MVALVVIVGGIVTTIYYSIKIRESLEKRRKPQAMDQEIGEDQDDLWEQSKVQNYRIPGQLRALGPKRTSPFKELLLSRFLSSS